MAMQPVDHLVAAVLAKDDTRILTLLGQDPDLAVARNMFGVSAVHAAHYTGATRLLSLRCRQRSMCSWPPSSAWSTT